MLNRITSSLFTALLTLGLLTGCGGERNKAVRKAEGEDQKDYKEMLERTRSRVAEKQIVYNLQTEIQNFQRAYGRLPTDLLELVQHGLIEKMPDPPEGTDFLYNPVRGNVRLIRKDQAQEQTP